MPRDNDKDKDRPPRGGRGGHPRGPGSRDSRPSRRTGGDERRPPRREASRPDDGKRAFGGHGKRRAFGDAPKRHDRDGAREERGSRSDFKPRFKRDSSEEARGPRKPYQRRDERGRDDARPARFSNDDRRQSRPRPEREQGERTRPEGKRFERKAFEHKASEHKTSERKNWQDHPRSESRAPRARNSFSERPRRDDRPPRSREKFGDRPRGEDKPFEKRERFSERPRGEGRPPRERDRFAERPRRDERGPRSRDSFSDRPRDDNRPPRGDRRFNDRPPRTRDGERRPSFDRPPFEKRDGERKRSFDRPSFDKRDRKPRFSRDDDRPRAPRAEPSPSKQGERIAKVVARAGLASRRDAEAWITEGRVAVNGRVITSPALDVTSRDVITVDGAPLPERERTRLFLYHKPRGLMTTHADPEGRPTVFENLPEGLPRLVSIGRLDFNTEGLLLLTNDGGLARVLELPETGWLRRYRVRAHGEVTQPQLDALRDGISIDGMNYGPIEATFERDQGSNVWLTVAIREGKNREVRNVLAHLGLEVNRLIRVSYGPFQLGEVAEGAVEEVKTRVLREQLGERVAKQANVQFELPVHQRPTEEDTKPKRRSGPVKPLGRSALIADRKGRKVLVQRQGDARERRDSDEGGFGPPRRPKRGYHGKRERPPRDRD